MICVAGEDSVVDRQSTILDVACQYLQKDARVAGHATAPGKVLFPTNHTGKAEIKPSIEPLVNKFAALTSQPSSINSIFGGSEPVFGLLLQPVKTMWTGIEMKEHGSYAIRQIPVPKGNRSIWCKL
jgi:hypothetical protein